MAKHYKISGQTFKKWLVKLALHNMLRCHCRDNDEGVFGIVKILHFWRLRNESIYEIDGLRMKN